MQSFALIFDMDGVIVDNVSLHETAWLEFCRKHQIDITAKLFREQLFGKSNKGTLKTLLGKEISNSELQRYVEEKESLYRQLAENQLKPLKGLMHFLQEVKKHNVKTAVASSAPVENISFTLLETNIGNYFDVITSADEIENGKPNPEIFIKTAAKLNFTPGQCLVFEDSFPGIEAAKRAGMKVVGVATTHSLYKLPHTDLNIVDFSKIDIDKIKTLFA